MTESELDKLKTKLPWNFSEMIHEKTNYSTHYIYKVLKGKRKNLKIMNAAKELAQSTQQEELELQKAIAEL